MEAITTLPADIYLFKVRNGNIRTSCKRDVVLVSLFLTSTCFTHSFRVSIVEFEQVNDGWVVFLIVGFE